MQTHCDLVLKGGITSGVIYPRLVAALAKRYRFKNIGGTSAGAIAAGAAAAAEYGRAHGHAQAFEQLAELPQQLGEVLQPDGRTRLFSLFRPVPALRRHFEVLVGALNASPGAAVRSVAWRLLGLHAGLVGLALLLGSVWMWPLLRSAWPGLAGAPLVGAGLLAMGLGALTVGAAAGALLAGRLASATAWTAAGLGVGTAGLWLGGPSTGVGMGMGAGAAGMPAAALAQAALHAAALLLLAALWLAPVLALVLWRFGRGLLAGLHGNGYGLCSGHGDADTPADRPALTDWLTAYFNQLAGKPADAPPLRFGELWGHDDPTQPRDIHLEVMTSAVSQQMAYALPLRPGSPRFHYDPVEWARLFPPSVMQALAQSAGDFPEGDAEGRERGGAERHVLGPAGQRLCPMPRRADWPVVVAVRMSLSFPLLLSAVPLYAIDRSLKASATTGPDGEPAAHAQRIWFSDGGIGSNLPLHMFDALLPGHPTFAVNLKDEHPDHPIHDDVAANEGGRVYLPTDNRGNTQRHWTPPADEAPLPGLIGFLGAIVGTLQNWRDELQFPYPGFRDRTVQISQRPDEGGLNLDMPPAHIAALSHAGEMAAQRLIDRFHPDGAEAGAGWRNHQRVRLGSLLGILQPGLAAQADALASDEWLTRLDELRHDRPQRALAGEFVQGLGRLAGLGPSCGLSLESGALKPLGQIRITPRI